MIGIVIVDFRSRFRFTASHVLEVFDDHRFLLQLFVGEVDGDRVGLEISVDKRLKIIFHRVEIFEGETIAEQIRQRRGRGTIRFARQFNAGLFTGRSYWTTFDESDVDMTFGFLNKRIKIISNPRVKTDSHH